MSPTDLALKLREKFGEVLSAPAEFRGETTLIVADAEQIENVCAFAKKDLGFDYLVDISSIDNYGEDPRFTIVYELCGYGHLQYLRLKTSVGEEKSELPTVSTVWRTANWHEREIYDMMGVRFRGHPDLRRILMWEGYPYFPLRKDFPLAGKSSEVIDSAFTNPAPLEGGPFVSVLGGKDAMAREPRVRIPETDELKTISRLERRRDLGRADEQNPAAIGENR
ncbi:MAG TPA: NADH-quinone oxidoreductase subunit C [Verrucomicrobiae bacterium]|nr:NADH-quinone oxidoreductase subunit C [Verrucomicrobiae bacterium]